MTNINVINQVILEMCAEVYKENYSSYDWTYLEENELLYEMAICIFGSQLVFEMAETMVNQLRDEEVLNYKLYENFHLTQNKIVKILDKPLLITFNNGNQKNFRPRFKNRLALLLATTMDNIYGKSDTIRGILLKAKDSKNAREMLIKYVCGFGPKQASLFLRRIGFCSELAVLDTHIIDYLNLNKTKELSLSSHKLSQLIFYEEIEEVFRNISNEFGYSIGCVDLAMWLTMRVAKREGFL